MEDEPSQKNALSLLAAVQKLGHTLAQLIQHARRAAQQNLAGENASPETLIDADTLSDIREQFQALVDEFPHAGELFFGIDKVDEFMSQFFDGSASPSLLGAASELGGFLDTQFSGFIERLIDWVFDDGIAGFRAEAAKFERFEIFIRALENLMQEVLDRWVLPGFYDFDGDEDDDA